MEYKVRIYIDEKIQDIVLTGQDKLSIGSGRHDDYQISYAGISESHLYIYKRNGKWFVRSADKELVPAEREIKDGDIFVLNKEHKVAVSVLAKDMETAKTINVANLKQVVLGRGAQCDLILQGNNISRRHAVITRTEGGYVLADNHSLNGTFVNGKKVEGKTELLDGDLIAIGRFNIRFRQETLTVSDADEEAAPEEKTIEYPYWFSGTPRLQRSLPTENISIQNPPQEASKPENSLFDALASPLVMACVMGASVALGVMTGGMLIFMAPMALLTCILAVRSRKKQEKKYKAQVRQRLEKYGAYLDEKERKIAETKNRQMVAMQENDPSAMELLRLMRERDNRLWSRDQSSGDFMRLRVGIGDDSSSFTVKGPQEGFSMEEDALLDRARKIVEDAQSVQDVPIACDLYKDRLVGVIGERKGALQLAKNLILQAAFHHSCEELKIVVVYTRREAADWDWVRWLPHVFDESREVRFVNSNGRPGELFSGLEEILKSRSMETEGERGTTVFSPYYLFVFTQLELSQGQPIMKYLQGDGRNLGAGALFLYDEMHRLPRECNTVIEIQRHSGMMIYKQDMNLRRKFKMDMPEPSVYEQFARELAPLRIPGSGAGVSLPSCITFLEGYGVHTPQELLIGSRWKSGYTNESMAVPIGVKTDGQPFMFDIHEKKYGPHGLVAGMTGSGKSEMVQSWILSMALKFSPQDVSFVLIDFKGTGLILPFANLPHLAGTISDLDHNIQRNLIALENELSRRKELLDKYGVNNINNYLKLYHAGKADEPLSFLFIIIDEFAEFKIQFPDFMTVVDRIFAIGRTLGVFAILLTQKPAGVVDDKMNANTRFRWCLKVASSADSKEMLRHPDAAKITTPGRAYVQVGEDEIYELVQSYYSGAPYRPDLKDQSTANQRVAVLEENGRRTYYENEEKKQAMESESSEISEVVNYIHQFVEEGNSQRAKQIWMPKMPYKIFLEELCPSAYRDGSWAPAEEGGLRPIVGLVDDPASQIQYPLVFDFTRDGHIAVFGAPGTGKTTILQTVVMSLIRSGSPEDVNIYIMDFGGWSMGIFRDFPHVGGIVNDNEDVKIEKLVQLLERKLSERKMKFSEIGVGSLAAYKQATGERLPEIVLVLDNFAPVLQLYPDLDGFFIRITREGGNYGIYLLVSAGNQMALGFKINQNIKMAAALVMADKSDYQGIVGKTNGLEPENQEGRGLIKGTPPLEFQAALPASGNTESERVRRIRELAEQMKRDWKGAAAAPIPIMPEYISYGSSNGIGLSVKFVEPVRWTGDRKHYYPVVGIPGGGKSNMMQLLAKQLSPQENIRIVYVAVKAPASGFAEGMGDGTGKITCITEPADLDIYMQELVPLLQERKEMHDSDAEAVFDPVYIFIDDFRALYEKVQEQTVKRLEAIMRLGEGLNVNLIIAENAETFCRMSAQGETITMMMAKENSGILLGGSMTSYPAFHAEMSGLEKNQALGQWEGYLLEKGKTVRFKAMSKD